MNYAGGVLISAESVFFVVLICKSQQLEWIDLWKQNKYPDRINTGKDLIRFLPFTTRFYEKLSLWSSKIYTQSFVAMITPLIEDVKKWLHF